MSLVMAAPPCRHLLLTALFALLAPQAAPAQPSGYTIETIAIEGDPAPWGGTVADFFLSRHRDLDADGRVLFYANEQGSADELIALHQGGALQLVVRDGDPAPGTGGEHFVTVAYPRFGAGDALAWYGNYTPSGSSPPGGAFARAGGVGSALALAGQAAPGGGSFETIVEVNDMNGAGDVLFHARVDLGGGVIDGLFLVRAGAILTVVREGDAAPVPGGGVFEEVAFAGFSWPAALSEAGAVAFRSGIAGGAHSQGVFDWTQAGGISPRLLPADPVQTPGGGTYTGFGSVISLNAAGELALQADFSRPGLFSPNGVFVVGPSAQREVIARYDELPGAGGEHFGQLEAGPPRINEAGDVTFVAISEEGSSGLLFVTRGRVLHRIALSGPVPDRPGVTFAGIHDDALLNDAGQLLLHAWTSAGEGLFLATPVAPEIPLAPPLALGGLAALIVAGARASRARRR